VKPPISYNIRERTFWDHFTTLAWSTEDGWGDRRGRSSSLDPDKVGATIFLSALKAHMLRRQVWGEEKGSELWRELNWIKERLDRCKPYWIQYLEWDKELDEHVQLLSKYEYLWKSREVSEDYGEEDGEKEVSIMKELPSPRKKVTHKSSHKDNKNNRNTKDKDNKTFIKGLIKVLI